MTRNLLAILTCAALLQTASAFALDNSNDTATAPGCGDPKVKFDVQTAKTHGAVQPDAAKAIIYFVEDDSAFNSFPKPTTRLGVDGTWAGATHGSSYFSIAVDPGVHHLCASWQSTLAALGFAPKLVAAHFAAEAGHIYYYSITNVLASNDAGANHVTLKLEPMDSDQGQLEASRFKLSSSHSK